MLPTLSSASPLGALNLALLPCPSECPVFLVPARTVKVPLGVTLKILETSAAMMFPVASTFIVARLLNTAPDSDPPMVDITAVDDILRR